MDDAQPGKKVLFSAMKNEGPFIVEWVAYHRAIGFDEIVICANDSTDGTTELLESLDENGYIRYVPNVMEDGVSAQGSAAKIFDKLNIVSDGDWVLWLDADEFLNVRIGNGTVDALIEKLGEKHGMLISWRLFGDSGNEKFSGRHISPSFTMASRRMNQSNRAIKTFFKHGPNFCGFTSSGVHRPKLAQNNTLDHSSFLNGKGQSLDQNDKRHLWWFDGTKLLGSSHIEHSDLGHGIAQINHYSVRTPEYFSLKKYRGRGWKADEFGEGNLRHTADFYETHNINQVVEESILRWESAVDREITEILAAPLIRSSHSKCLEKSQDAIAEIQSQMTVPLDVGVKIPVVTLPDTERAFLEQHYNAANAILEYGSGGSTFLAIDAGVEHIMSVESDANWAANMVDVISQKHPEAKNVFIHHVDIGQTKAWGRPKTDAQWKNYHLYPLSVWDQTFFSEPDLVLIDGRFRVGCFIATALRIRKKTTVLFDDYVDRPEYHVVESLAKPVETAGRMAKFVLEPIGLPRKNLVDKVSLTDLIGWFNLVQ